MFDRLRKILRWKRVKSPKFPLKFYDTHRERWNVQYDNVHLCTCKTDEKEEIQNYFDKTFKGDNLYEISKVLKEKYNLKIQINKTYSKRKTKKPKLATYKTAKLCFNNVGGGRVQVKVRDNGVTHTICNCYPSQKEEVLQKYNILKKNNNLETIKIILKKEYNLKK